MLELHVLLLFFRIARLRKNSNSSKEPRLNTQQNASTWLASFLSILLVAIRECSLILSCTWAAAVVFVIILLSIQFNSVVICKRMIYWGSLFWDRPMLIAVKQVKACFCGRKLTQGCAHKVNISFCSLDHSMVAETSNIQHVCNLPDEGWVLNE